MTDPGLVLAALARRLTLVEARLAALEAERALASVDELARREALGVAEQMGLAPDVLSAGRADGGVARSVQERRLLARALRERGWSDAGIAHVMVCSERTIERYLSDRQHGNS